MENVFTDIRDMFDGYIKKEGINRIQRNVNASYLAYYQDNEVIFNLTNLPHNKADLAFIMLHELSHIIFKEKGMYMRSLLESYSTPEKADYMAVEIINEIITLEKFSKIKGYSKSAVSKIIKKLTPSV